MLEQSWWKFWDKVDTSAGIDACWPFKGALDRWGYGRFRRKAAHRVAFHLAFGREAQDFVLHKCDNAACCQPQHLYEGTHAQNMRDMVERKRVATGSRNGRHVHGQYVGERIPGTRLRASAHPELTRV